MRRWCLRASAATLVALAVLGNASAAAQDDPLAEEVRGRIEAILDELQQSGDFVSATAALQDQFDRVIAGADAADKDLFREAAFAMRLVAQLKEVEGAERLELLAFLRAHEDLAATLAFLVQPEHGQTRNVCQPDGGDLCGSRPAAGAQDQ
jgi:hypothetical protein